MTLDETTKQALKALFVAFPAQEKTGTERELVATYLIALEGIESDFIAQACKRFIQGHVERSIVFRPTPPELARECRRLQQIAKRSSQLSAMPRRPRLALPEPPPMSAAEEAAMRERVGAGFQQLQAELRRKVAAFVPKRRSRVSQ